MRRVTLTWPDDWHVHFRDGEYLNTTVVATARCFQRAIAMPNLVPPITELDQLVSYRDRILAQVPSNQSFTPLMTFYLTDNLKPDVIEQAADRGLLTACKLYPAGATTNSDAGVTDIKNIYPVLEVMSNYSIPLLVHGEVTDQQVDIFDREAKFIQDILSPVVEQFPHLKIVMEHITTEQAVTFVNQAPANVAATITIHHMLLNRNDMLVGGIKPHYYCLPILKRAKHQQALVAAAISGNKKFFLGTDTAPHTVDSKQSACGCAGIYSAPIAIELYAQLFAQHDALDKLEAFASFNGPDFYGLKRNTRTMTLVNKPWQVPDVLSLGKEKVIPFWAGKTIDWQLCDE